jgi:thiol-disulfide isomerase/thioredoxin
MIHTNGSSGRTGDLLTRRRLLHVTGAAGATLLAGCSGDGGDGGDTGGSESPDAGSGNTDDTAVPESVDDGGSGMDSGWRSMELTTVRDEETFTIAGLDGPVVIQSFAVWCPKCQRQSETIANLDGSFTRVGLNTDPNEDAVKVRDHAESNGFDWRFAVAPAAMTESLIDEFGTSVANAPSTPVIVVCPDGEAAYMSGSQSSVEEITSAADEC